jgi:hypothetical protein
MRRNKRMEAEEKRIIVVFVKVALHRIFLCQLALLTLL